MSKWDEQNKKDFAELLRKAKGSRSINKYSYEVGISPAHTSRLLREMIDTPPLPATIRKYAKGAVNDVTYEELMFASGYINEETMSNSKSTVEKSNIEKKIMQVVLSELYSSDFGWSINKPTETFINMFIKYSEGKYLNHYIFFEQSPSLNEITKRYGQILLLNLKAEDKVSIITDNYTSFGNMLNNQPKNINANIFVSLADIDNGKIIVEREVCIYSD